MFLGTLVYPLFSYVDTGTIDISFIYSVVLSEALFIICKDPSHSDNISILLS